MVSETVLRQPSTFQQKDTFFSSYRILKTSVLYYRRPAGVIASLGASRAAPIWDDEK